MKAKIPIRSTHSDLESNFSIKMSLNWDMAAHVHNRKTIIVIGTEAFVSNKWKLSSTYENKLNTLKLLQHFKSAVFSSA